MDTNESEIPGNSTAVASEESSQHKEILEIEITPDGINSDKEKVLPTKEAIEILKVELVVPGKITREINETQSPIKSNEEIQENACNDKQKELENDIHIEPNTAEHIDENDIEKSNAAEANDIRKELDNGIHIEPNTVEHIDELVEADIDKSNAVDKNFTTASGLSMLAQYDSDNENESSDADSVIEVPITSSTDYRNQVVEINSDTDSDDSASDVEYLNELRKTIEKRIETVDDDEDEDDGDDNAENSNKKRHKQKLKVKGELLLEDLPPIQDLKITVPEDECIEFGKIHSIVDQLVLVSVLPNSILLDLETVLFLERGQKVLGEVFDVLGQVADPWYCVRFNSNKQIQEKQINVGDKVYVAPKTQYTQYVILSNLINQKGSDASWENDIEPPPKFLDYSDDEQEQQARRQLRNKDRKVDNDDPTKKPRTTENDEEFASTSGRSEFSTQHRVNRSENRRGSAHNNSYPRMRNYAQNQCYQKPQNYHQGSWHSNYYRPPFPSHYQPTTNYRPQQNQAYPSQYPMYPIPPLHNMPYPSISTQYTVPPMTHQHAVQIMPNTFSAAPVALQGPPIHPQQYSLSPPPPPGSQ